MSTTTTQIPVGTWSADKVKIALDISAVRR